MKTSYDISRNFLKICRENLIKILIQKIFQPILRVEAKVDLIASYNCLCQNVNHRLTRSSFFPNITNHPKESSDLAPVFHEITRCRIHRWQTQLSWVCLGWKNKMCIFLLLMQRCNQIGFQIRGVSSNVVGTICPLGWNRVT